MTRDVVSKKLELAKLKQVHSRKLLNCYSSLDMDSKPTYEQQRFLDDFGKVRVRWVVSSNRAGKSQAAARETAWLFNGHHPTVNLKEKWGDSPLTIIILCKKIKIMEEELWRKKIKPLLTTSNVTEKFGSSGIESARNEDNGNLILFQSHNNPSEARKNIQGYSTHYVWLDEMPEDASLISELMLRVIDVEGSLVATFTPLVNNILVKNLVVNSKEPTAKRYKFLLKDNPIFAGRVDQVIEDIRQICATTEEFNCRVHGEWMGAGRKVSCYDAAKHKQELPTSYHNLGWRHLAIVDPSASGLTGLTVWAEDPSCGNWYNVIAKELNGDAAFILVEEVEKILKPFNIVSRICDPNPAGFYKEAARVGIRYITVPEKANRKRDLIDNSNKMLVTGKMILTQHSDMLEKDLSTCIWSEANPDKIVKASSFHCFDTFQYGADNLPKFDPTTAIHRNFEQQLRYDFHTEKKKKLAKQNKVRYNVMSKARRQSRFRR